MSTNAVVLSQIGGGQDLQARHLRPVVELDSPPNYVRRRLAVVLVVALALATVGSLVSDHVAGTSATQLAAGAPGLDPASGVGGAAVSNDAPIAPAGLPAASAGSYVVQPGDTVWSIARVLAHGQSVSQLVQQISDANGGVDLVVGQRLTLP